EPSVGEWIQCQDVSAVAMDCFPEKPFWLMMLTSSERGANHKRWLKAGIPMIQMLTALDRVGPKFMLIALPLNLRGMDGAPARVMGIENGDKPMGSSRVRFDELRREARPRLKNPGDVGRSEMARKQCGAMLHALLHQLPACRARDFRQFAKFRVPVRRVHLQRVMQHVTAEYRAAAGIGEPNGNMAMCVTGRGDDCQDVVDRIVPVDENSLPSLDHRQ